ncbi:MAG: epoxyqueuosine reductase [Thermoguttaceae bacterium]
MKELARKLGDYAVELGFELVGVAQAGRPSTFEHYENWISGGKHAGMDFLAKNPEARSDPDFILSGVKSLLMLGVSVQTVVESDEELRAIFFANRDKSVIQGSVKDNIKDCTTCVTVASYAAGVDYHIWIRERLKKLSAKHRELTPHGKCRGIVDTAPLLERQFAVNAGLGKIGKNTMLINKKLGSRFFIAALLTTEQLAPLYIDDTVNVCENCSRCCDACPTGALTPYELDARKCLNYWTIEYPASKETGAYGPETFLPEEIKKNLGNDYSKKFFGCEICQAVCPWNRENDFTAANLPLPDFEDADNSDTTRFYEQLSRTPLGRVLNPCQLRNSSN